MNSALICKHYICTSLIVNFSSLKCLSISNCDIYYTAVTVVQALVIYIAATDCQVGSNYSQLLVTINHSPLKQVTTPGCYPVKNIDSMSEMCVWDCIVNKLWHHVSNDICSFSISDS